MVSVENNHSDDHLGFIEKSGFLLLFFCGVVLSLLETIYMLILGNTLENAVWPLAIRTLELTFFLRENMPLVTIFVHHLSLQVFG